LISAQKVKDRSVLTDNVDDKLIEPQIKYVQDVHLESVLGSKFYKGLQTRVDEGTLSEDEENLLKDYISDMLVNYVLAELVVPLSFKMWNKGVLQKTADNAIAPDYKTIQDLAGTYRDKAEIYKNRLIMYLREYGDTLFEEFRVYAITFDALLPQRKAFSSPIYLGNYGKGHGLGYGLCDRCNGENCLECKRAQTF
jgi:hypothetical protein